APMLEVYQLVIDLDQRPRWLSAVERLDRPATTERSGVRHTRIFPRVTVEWVAVKSDIGDDEITYVEEGRIVEKDLPARASFILKRLGERKTSLQFHAKWLSRPGLPRERPARPARRRKKEPPRFSGITSGPGRRSRCSARKPQAFRLERSGRTV